MAPVWSEGPNATASTDAEFEAAVGAIEGELSVVFGSAARVEAACARVLASTPGPVSLARVERLGALLPLIHARPGPASRPVVCLLLTMAAAAADPWPLLAGLFASRQPGVGEEALDTALALAASGPLRAIAAAMTALARAVELEGSPLRQPAALRKAGELLGWLATPPGGAGTSALVTVLTGRHDPLVKRLAARVLDESAVSPTADLVDRLLGESAARTLAPYLAYTNATHADLLDLASDDNGTPVALPTIVDAERQLGIALLRDVIAELGWARINLGMATARVAGISVGGSLPFLVTPAEAPLLDRHPEARRVLDRFVVVAHGGRAVGPADPDGAAGVVSRFRAYNLAHAEVLGHILDVAPLDADRVREILALMDRIVADYLWLFGSRPGECDGLAALYEDLEARILEALAEATPGQPLSSELTRLVQMFEDPRAISQVHTLHGLKRFLHQRGLTLGFGLLESGQATNRTVDLLVASTERALQTLRRIEYVEFEPEPGDGGAPRLPYAVAIVAEGFARQLLLTAQTFPSVKVFCYGNEVHYFVTYRNHPAFIRIDYSPPLGGGMIDLQYYGVSKYELDGHPNLALDAVRAFFERLDFYVRVENTRIHARYDKERAISLADVCEKAEALFRLVPYLMDLDWTIGQLALTPAGRSAVERAWAALFDRWGVLPVEDLLTEDRCHVLAGREPSLEGTREVPWSGVPPYRDAVSDRPDVTLMAAVRAEVEERRLAGLAVPERADIAAQIPLERHLLRPLRTAVARGELLETADGLVPAPADLFGRHSEVRAFVQLLQADDETLAAAARLAALVAALERSLHFETSGSVNGYDVQRAALALRGETFTLYVLRDEGGIARLAAFVEGHAMTLRRSSPDAPWRDNVHTDVGSLAVALRRNNFLPAWIDPPSRAPASESAGLRTLFSTPSLRRRRPPLPRERVLSGVKASPGRAVGLARLGIAGRQPADLEGGILLAPTVGPEDNTFLFKAAGIVCTGGGILSHAGLLAVQFGRPALIVSGGWEEDPAGERRLAYRRVEFTEQETRLDGYRIVERLDVREFDDWIRDGDLLELDADESALRVLGQDPAALALHDGLRQLGEANRRLAAASSDADVLAHRGRRLHALHLLERLLGRINDPMLARHAVRELLAGVTASPGGRQREDAQLLGVLMGNVALRDFVRTCVAQEGEELARRAAAAGDAARRLLPVSANPAEVLGARIDAHRTAEALQTAREACQPVAPLLAEAHEHALDEIDRLALDALERRRAALVARARCGLDASPSAMRHVLHQLARLSTVLPLPDEDRRDIDALRRQLAARDAAAVEALQGRAVLGPGDGGLEMQPLVGWKAANLAEIARLGEGDLVPAWFAVTDRAFRQALASPVRGSSVAGHGGDRTLAAAIAGILARAEYTNAQKSIAIRQLWLDVRLSGPIVGEVADAYRRLGAPHQAVDPATMTSAAWPGSEVPPENGEPYVAIRSSACEEDTEAATRAGEFETFLFVRGEAAVIEHIQRAWSGLWTERAIHTRSALGLAAGGQGGGVLVQRIAWCRLAGVLQTANVAAGSPREMVVNVGLGMGEGIVSGTVSADLIVVSKEDVLGTSPLRFRYLTADKRARVVFDVRTGRGTVRADTLSHQRLRPALEYIELLELVRAAARLEAIYDYPLDIEFGFEGPRLRILQVRPTPGLLTVWRETAERYPLQSRPAPATGNLKLATGHWRSPP